MAATNQTNVLAAFEMLLEEIENEVELVNRAGSRAFDESNYERAATALEQGKKLADFRARVAGLRREWRELVAAFDVEAGEDEEVAAQRRDLGRLERGTRTPEDAFRMPILKTLAAMGGAGKTADVLDRVGEIMKGKLKDVDYEDLPSSSIPRWRNTAQWARNTMVNEGLLKDDSPRGVWEISEAGREYLETQTEGHRKGRAGVMMSESLQYYAERFAKLNTDRSHTWGEKTQGQAPHKAFLLLSVLDQFAKGAIRSNLIELTPELEESFDIYWSAVKPTGRDRGNVVTPFFHLRKEGFWHLQPGPGHEGFVKHASTIQSAAKLRETVLGAKLDDELYELLHIEESREALRRVLLETYFAPEIQARLLT